ncbi:hypothetical protein BBD39_11185 [Arsenophonus endosymbiont of Bemisia tabaci Asia II 3]|nr:hypothetical protein BBD39_11185 [Arsenophonus endosymbiont of Bemisia tabaci Asia II 3]
MLTIAAGHSCEGWSHDCDVYVCVLAPSQALSPGIAVDVARTEDQSSGRERDFTAIPALPFGGGRGDKNDEPRYKSLAGLFDG